MLLPAKVLHHVLQSRLNSERIGKSYTIFNDANCFVDVGFMGTKAMKGGSGYLHLHKPDTCLDPEAILASRLQKRLQRECVSLLPLSLHTEFASHH